MAEEASATNLMRAQFDVNRAKLDVVDRDFVARIDLERARLTLSDAEQRLIEAEKKQVSDRAVQATELARRTRRQRPRPAGPRTDPARHRQPRGARAVGRHGEPDAQRRGAGG